MEAFLILIIFAGVIAFIASPFFKKGADVWETAVIDSKMNRLRASKESYYTAIKDVDFEFAEGKLSEKDYSELRGYYKEKAILTIKEMEKLKASAPRTADGSQEPEIRSQKGKGQRKGKR